MRIYGFQLFQNDSRRYHSENMSPKLSVVIPNYNDAEYIWQAIESVLKEDYENLELIVVDDGSVDNSLEVIRRYSSDRRVRVIARQQNKGVVYTLNEGISNAQGEYLYLFSANDFIFPEFISKSMQQLILRPDIGVCTSNCSALMPDNTHKKHICISWCKTPLIVESKDAPKMCFKTRMTFGGNTSIVQADFLRKEGGLKANLLSLSDWYLITSIAYRTGFIHIPEILTGQRYSENCYSKGILRNKEKRKQMYSELLNELSTDPFLISQFRKSGELGFILKFAPAEILKRPAFWNFCPTAIRRYVKRKIKKALKEIAESGR